MARHATAAGSAVGRRADLVLVDTSHADQPRVVASIVAGRIVQLNDVERLAVSVNPLVFRRSP
jgi:cytosine/adenosine deaminase-related metal-dependent hydrolase